MGRTVSKAHARSSLPKPNHSTSAQFIEPMLLVRTDCLPSGEQWLYELKLDGYRVIAFKRNGAVHLRSRNDNDFNARYPGVVAALARLPDNTVIDGEVVAFDPEGRPSFNALQNYGSASAQVVYYVFDVMVLAGQNVMREPLQKRRERLEKTVLPKLPELVRYSAPLDECVPLHSRPRQDAWDARPRLKIRAQPGSLQMNDTRRNTRRLSWRQRKKLCRSALSFPP